MQTTDFLAAMESLGVTFYTGVPDSLLKPLNDTLYARYGASGRHMVAANEGGAVGLAAAPSMRVHCSTGSGRCQPVSHQSRPRVGPAMTGLRITPVAALPSAWPMPRPIAGRC